MSQIENAYLILNDWAIFLLKSIFSVLRLRDVSLRWVFYSIIGVLLLVSYQNCGSSYSPADLYTPVLKSGNGWAYEGQDKPNRGFYSSQAQCADNEPETALLIEKDQKAFLLREGCQPTPSNPSVLPSELEFDPALPGQLKYKNQILYLIR